MRLLIHVTSAIRRVALRFALGWSAYDYMVRSLGHDPRCGDAREVDIVVRKDGVERRIEADWLKDLARLTAGRCPPIESRNWLERQLRRRLRWPYLPPYRRSE